MGEKERKAAELIDNIKIEQGMLMRDFKAFMESYKRHTKNTIDMLKELQNELGLGE